MNFENFLLEKLNPEQEKIKIVILTKNRDSSPLYTILSQYNENPNHTLYSVDVNSIKSIEEIEGKNAYYFRFATKNKEDLRISPSNTVIIFRKGVVDTTASQMIANRLEELNFFCVNPLQSMITCDNKYLTHLRFVNSGVKTPKTNLVSNIRHTKTAIKEIGGKYPFVMKILQGTHGKGVNKIKEESSFTSFYQTCQAILNKPNIEFLIQECIEADYDLRIHVVKNNSKVLTDPMEKNHYDIIGVMRRNKAEGDFRTNYSLGATIENVDDSIFTEEVKRLAIDAAKSVGGYWVGVDIIIDKNTNVPYVLEVNTSSGVKGITQVDNEFPKKLLAWLTNKNNWVSNIKVIGYLEKMTVKGIGDFVAKFDTGNGALCSTLLAEKIKITDDNKVKWEINGKKYVKEFVKYIEPSVGTEVHKRPVVKLNIEFLGKKYRGVEFALTDNRLSKSTPILINRKFMRVLGVTIDSSETFKLGEFINNNTGESYNAKESMKEPYNGVNLF